MAMSVSEWETRDLSTLVEMTRQGEWLVEMTNWWLWFSEVVEDEGDFFGGEEL